MRTALTILVSLLAVLSAQAAEQGAPVSELIRISQEKPSGLEELARRGGLILQNSYLRKPWLTVRADLVKQGFAIPAGTDLPHNVSFEIPLRKAVVKAGGYPFDLSLVILTDRKQAAEGKRGDPGTVIRIAAELSGTVRDESAEIVSADLFGAGSALSRVLSSERCRELTRKRPFLRHIEFSYYPIAHHRESVFPYGYHLTLKFGPAADQDPNQAVYFTVRGNKDLPRNLDGDPVNNWKGWEHTALFDVHLWGHNEWSPGK